MGGVGLRNAWCFWRDIGVGRDGVEYRHGEDGWKSCVVQGSRYTLFVNSHYGYKYRLTGGRFFELVFCF